ncbi:hypothetical protein H6G33_09860 [Calothrix sp. FACHB-1219]|uniref:hypothetical protein n=1 Tax=unclassified Calothrix TaxID=2619626 RepID=UPI0016892F30|nr:MULTISPECIES: hypothetical protein [unclassified Calothrix]MBD2201651.1 hypothetical protein [Calothrix sp. FACHB-168]MBD2217337.1 hypothetical protein [Calothrix sp. FACHB-1219]
MDATEWKETLMQEIFSSELWEDIAAATRLLVRVLLAVILVGILITSFAKDVYLQVKGKLDETTKRGTVPSTTEGDGGSISANSAVQSEVLEEEETSTANEGRDIRFPIGINTR